MASLPSFLSTAALFSPPPSVNRSVSPRSWRVFSCLTAEPKQTSSVRSDLRDRLSEESRQTVRTESEVFVRTYARTPVVFVSGKGCKLNDVEGREYLDLAGGIAVNSVGHGDPDWLRAVVDQAGVLAHVSNIFYTLPQVELGKRLVDSSFADRVFFTNSGTEANEAAIKFARKFQRSSRQGDENVPTEFIAYTNCFHGRTMGALSLTSKEQYRKPFEPLMPGVSFIDYGDIEASRNALKSGKVAAVFVEPVQGEGGIYSVSKEFLQGLRSACDEAGALLIFDEVQCGLGRTGFLWAHEAFDVYPDMMTLAKPLAGGLPIGAVLAAEKVAAAIGFGDHGSTFAGGPLVCSAALAVLDKIQNPEFLDNVSKKGLLLKELLSRKLGNNHHVKEVRGFGLIAGIELDAPAAPLVEECLRSGLLVLTAGKGNVVRLVPPLIISEEEIEQAVEILSNCIPVLDLAHS